MTNANLSLFTIPFANLDNSSWLTFNARQIPPTPNKKNHASAHGDTYTRGDTYDHLYVAMCEQKNVGKGSKITSLFPCLGVIFRYGRVVRKMKILE